MSLRFIPDAFLDVAALNVAGKLPATAGRQPALPRDTRSLKIRREVSSPLIANGKAG
jgi:hypothetical protein